MHRTNDMAGNDGVIKCKNEKSRSGGKNMEKKIRRDSAVMWVLKSLLVSYMITGILLLLLTLAVYKFEMEENIVSAGIIAIYVVSTLIGGIIIGKCAEKHRFLWGLGLGIAYFLLLLFITLGVYHTLNDDVISLLTTLLICMGGGMLGGMIS
jgi:putative membrane protein (TIGR04086 family)